MANEFDLTKQFQKSIGRILETVDDASYIAVVEGEIGSSFEKIKALIKHELWNLHDIVNLQNKVTALEKKENN